MLKKLVDALPKTELHIHIEGSLEPEMMFDLARRNRVELPYPDVQAIRAAYRFDCLQDFLDLYYQGMSVLQTEQDFFDLTWAYLEKCRQQNVVHTEIFFDPQGHTERGVSLGTVMTGICGALDEAREQSGISSHLIMCFLRHLDEQSALQTLEDALPWRDRITGVGLDSSELGHPPSKFTRVFARAGEMGFRRVAHAGEEGPPVYVHEAIELLGVDRIDHGNRSLEDTSLVERLAADRVPLTVCPQSNLRLAVVNDMRAHPIREMLAAGLRASIHSDDPAYFGGYVNENYHALIDALDLNRDEILLLVRNGFESAFLPDAEIRSHLARVDAVAAAFA
jgi:adenosine deaminase